MQKYLVRMNTIFYSCGCEKEAPVILAGDYIEVTVRRFCTSNIHEEMGEAKSLICKDKSVKNLNKNEIFMHVSINILTLKYVDCLRYRS